MKDNSIAPSGIADYSVDSTRSYESRPHLTTETTRRASSGRRLLGALTGDSNRRLPGFHSLSSGAAPSSLLLSKRFIFPLFALLAVGLLFLLSGGPLHAQDAADPIEYAENGTGPVATFTADDPEADHIIWSLSGVDARDFTIVGGVLRFDSTPDYETPVDTGGNNTYVVTVTASDGTNSDTEDVEIEVTNVDEAGTVMLSTLQPQVEVALTATLTDSDVVSGTPTWMWFRGNDIIAGAIGDTYTPMAGDVGSVLKAKATYRDGEDTKNDKNAEAPSVHAVRAKPATNIAPTFPDQDLTATGPQTAQTRMVAENTPSGRNIGAAVVATDSGDVVTYSIDDTAEGTFDIDRANGQLKTQTPLNAEETASYSVTVTATDPFGASATALVTITVTDVDEDPSITAGAETAHSFEETAAIASPLDTYAATDPENLTISWDVSGPDAGKFSITDAGALTFETQPDFESPGDANGDNVYEVTVVASDPGRNSDELEVRVKVTNVAELGTIEFSSLSPKVGVALTAEFDDPDGDVTGLMWQWSVTGATGTDATTNGDIEDADSDTYTPVAGDVGGTLVATATYRDGSLAAGADAITLPSSATAAVVADTDNKAPVFPDQDNEMAGRQTDQERTVAENTDSDMGIGDPVAATDVATAANGTETPETLTYTLGGADAASFSIARGTGQLSTKADLDYETKRSYTVTVTATDPGGLSATAKATIKVTAVDEDPELSGEAPEEYAENGRTPVATFTASDPERATITWSLTGDDAEDFTIVGGVLRFDSTPDYETPADTGGNNTYVVTVTASDGTNSDTEHVEIEVTNVDEAGTVMLSTLQPQVEVALTATLTDSDVVSGTPTWMWFRGSSVIVNATTATYEPVVGDIGSVLKAKATYRDGEDTDNDKNAEGRSARSVRRVPTGGNTDPAFPDQNPSTTSIETAQTRMVAENTPSGRNIGAAVVATDPGDVVTYSIDDTAEGTFDIDRANGQLKTQTPLNAEETASYSVTVTATDPFGASATALVTITVTDVDEDPSITAGAETAHSFEETAAIASPLDTYAATDPENLTISWDVSGPDAGKFSITDAGALTFETQPDFESPGDANGDNVYEVTVVASDPGRNSDELEVRVKVTNVAELGTIEFSSLSPKVGVALTAEFDDPDGDVTGLMWQWSVTGATGTDATTNGDIEDADSDTYTPVAGDIGGTLVATVTYRDGSLAAGADAITLPSSATAAVVADTDNKAPVFPDQDNEMAGRQTDQERMIGENTAADMDIGDPVVAMDKATATDGTETDETLTYTLGGADAASFSIDRASGQLKTKAKLDYETKRSYTVTVTATDPGGLTATATVTIEVTGVDEAPEIMRGGLAISGMRSITRAENNSASLATYTSTGPESASTMWSLSGADADDFTIAGGVLAFSSTPDFESPADADGDNVYELAVEATDETYTAVPWDVTVMVTNVEEDGVVTLSADPQVGVELTASLADPDGDVSGMAWQWAREDGAGGFDDIASATSAAYTPGADDDGNLLRATVTYTDGEGADKSAEATSAAVEPEAAACGIAEDR